MRLEEIQQQAQREIASEQFRAAVEAEKARIRTRQSLWSRLLAWLPFTITRKQK